MYVIFSDVLTHNNTKSETVSCSVDLTLCNPMDCSPSDSSVHGILQAIILEWVAFPSPGDLPLHVTKLGSLALQTNSLLSEPPRKPQKYKNVHVLSFSRKIWYAYKICHYAKSCKQSCLKLLTLFLSFQAKIHWTWVPFQCLYIP